MWLFVFLSQRAAPGLLLEMALTLEARTTEEGDGGWVSVDAWQTARSTSNPFYTSTGRVRSDVWSAVVMPLPRPERLPIRLCSGSDAAVRAQAASSAACECSLRVVVTLLDDWAMRTVDNWCVRCKKAIPCLTRSSASNDARVH